MVAHRDDVPGHLGRLADHLNSRYGASHVAILDDVSTSGLGDELRFQYSAFILIMGQGWPAPDEDSSDLARVVANALHQGIPLLPLTASNRPPPTAADLPPNLAGIARLNVVEIADGDWHSDLRSRVYPFLDRELGGRWRRFVRSRWMAFVVVVVAILFSLIGFGLASRPPITSALAPINPGAKNGFSRLTTSCYSALVSRPVILPTGNGCSAIDIGATDEIGVVLNVIPVTYGDLPRRFAYPDEPRIEGLESLLREQVKTNAKVVLIEVDGDQAAEIDTSSNSLLIVNLIVRLGSPVLTENGQAPAMLITLTGPAGSKRAADRIVGSFQWRTSVTMH